MKFLPATAMRHRAEYLRTLHHVEVAEDVTIDDILTAGFWRHHSSKLRKDDLIDIIHQSGKFDITVRVGEVGNGFANVRLLRKWVDEAASKAEEEAGDAPDGYIVDHTPRTLWRVRMKDSGEEIARNMKTRHEANAAAAAHAMKMNSKAA